MNKRTGPSQLFICWVIILSFSSAMALAAGWLSKASTGQTYCKLCNSQLLASHQQKSPSSLTSSNNKVTEYFQLIEIKDKEKQKDIILT